MPDLSRCKYVHGSLLCWDKAGRQLVEITITPVDFSRCGPQVIKDVMTAFLGDDDNEAEDQCRKA